jgi:lipoprotein-releasing system permease protein
MVEPDTYQVVVGYGIAQNFRWGYSISTAIRGFSPKPGKGNIEMQNRL